MPGLIQKSGYIKPGNGGGHYAQYIATREGCGADRGSILLP